jgi:hypothetical protein
MKTLKKTRLSSSRLTGNPVPKIPEIDSPIPLRIKDLIPATPKKNRLELSNQEKTKQEVMNSEFLKQIIEIETINKR